MFLFSRESMGINLTVWNPQDSSRKGATYPLIRLNLSYDQLTVPIFVTTAIMLFTPKAVASIACSFVCPSFSKPDSNSPYRADMTRRAISAWQAPVIMLGT